MNTLRNREFTNNIARTLAIGALSALAIVGCSNGNNNEKLEGSYTPPEVTSTTEVPTTTTIDVAPTTTTTEVATPSTTLVITRGPNTTKAPKTKNVPKTTEATAVTTTTTSVAETAPTTSVMPEVQPTVVTGIICESGKIDNGNNTCVDSTPAVVPDKTPVDDKKTDIAPLPGSPETTAPPCAEPIDGTPPTPSCFR